MNFRQLFIYGTVWLSGHLVAQENTEQAFSKSYAFEYETQYTKAISALAAAGTDSYQVNLRLGWLYYLAKDYVRSETFYRKAVAQESLSVEARFGLALPMSATGNWNGVLEAYEEILKIDPNNSIANYRTASIFYSRRDYNGAAQYVGKVLKMYPFDYDSNLLNGKILVAMGKTGEARRALEKALQYNPQSAEAKATLKKLQ